MKTEAEIRQAVDNQKRVCAEKMYPNFAPWDGKCYGCNQNIYQDVQKPWGISIGLTGLTPVTGCPHCNKSYVD